MSHSKGQFNDTELASFAIEILKDLCTKPQTDPYDDVFICELAEEIEKELIANVESSSYYTDPSIYFPSGSNTSAITSSPNASQYSDLPPIPHARLSPTIVSRYQLAHNDSFNHSIPSLPSSPALSPKGKSHFKFSGNTKPKQTTSVPPNTPISPRFLSPLHPPPPQTPPIRARPVEPGAAFDIAIMGSKSIKSDVSSCISPRYRQTPTKVSSIPNFSDVIAIHITKKPKRLPKKPRLSKKPKKSAPKKKNKTKRKERSIYNKGDSMRYRSRSTKHIHSKMSKRAPHNTRQVRSSSHEYAVKVDGGFIFGKPKSYKY